MSDFLRPISGRYGGAVRISDTRLPPRAHRRNAGQRKIPGANAPQTSSPSRGACVCRHLLRCRPKARQSSPTAPRRRHGTSPRQPRPARNRTGVAGPRIIIGQAREIPMLKVVSLCPCRCAVRFLASHHPVRRPRGPERRLPARPGQSIATERRFGPIPIGSVARPRSLVSDALADSAVSFPIGPRKRHVDRPESLRKLASSGSESVAHAAEQPPRMPATRQTPVQKQRLAQQWRTPLARARRLRSQARAPPRAPRMQAATHAARTMGETSI